jgi:hypothetical protein
MTNFYESFSLIDIPVNKFISKKKDLKIDRVCNVLYNVVYTKLCKHAIIYFRTAFHIESSNGPKRVITQANYNIIHTNIMLF